MDGYCNRRLSQRCYLPGDVHWTVDVDDPEFAACPTASIDLDCNPVAITEAQAIADAGTVTDACGTVDVTAVPDAPPSNISGCEWTQTWTVTAKDACGNSSACSVTYIWKSAAPVVLSCPENTVIPPCQSQAAIDMAYADWLATATVSGGCNTSLSNDAPEGLLPCGGLVTVTFTATSECEGPAECMATFAITEDLTAPEVICPEMQTVPLDENCMGTLGDYTALATATDACGVVSVTQDPLPGGSYTGVQTITVTITAIDGCSNSGDCTFEVLFRDVTQPSIVCPENIAVDNDPGICSAVVDYTVTASDNCGGVSVTQTGGLASGATFPVGTTTCVFEVADGSNLVNSCQFTVTVNDIEPPTFTCVESVIRNHDPGVCTYRVVGTEFNPIDVMDNCGVASSTYSVVDGAGATPNTGNTLANALFNEGSTTIEWTFTDVNGNPATCQTVVTVIKCNVVAGRLIWVGDTITGVGMAKVYLFNNIALPPVSTFNSTPATGDYSLTAPNNGVFTVRPEKTINPLNGLALTDAIAIQQHLTGFALIPYPYRRIAADVNKSYSISTVDASIVQQAILGNPSALNILKATKSWRFVPTSYAFPPPVNNFVLPVFPETRSVTVSGSDVLGQDFYGIKVGDVIQNGIPGLGTANPDNKPEDGKNPEPVIFTVIDRELNAGETESVQFDVSNFLDIAGYQLALRFDPSVLEFDHIEIPGSDLLLTEADNFGLFEIKKGEIRALWSTAMGINLNNGTAVFRLVFKSKVNGVKLSDVLNLATDVVPEQAFTTGLRIADVQLVYTKSLVLGTGDPGTASGIELFQNQPNPFAERTNIGFILPEACEAELRVLDINGRLLHTEKAFFTAGAHMLNVDLSGETATGLMYYELITPYGKASKKMVMTGKESRSYLPGKSLRSSWSL
ncbi:MAG: HYR domain-containing protein [Lewinellaceae bacterium]|nr:HYR domain-containing protein [Lewinellaceae bacterium]